jgi:two-component system, OmpR family, response regulator RegX3
MGQTIVVGVLEDEPIQCELMRTVLEGAGMAVETFGTVVEFRRKAGEKAIDILLLDWNLPGESGLDLVQQLRESQGAYIPVIFITANQDEDDIVTALQAGADDYITKPARPNEVLARVRAQLRRNQIDTSSNNDTTPFIFDNENKRLAMHGDQVELTEREYDLLHFLFVRAGRVVSREALLTQVWRVGPQVATRSLDTYVSRLRKRLGLSGENGWKLEGIYQHGYRLSRVNKH